ncbi:putative 4'-phosphopantetheinyl transferase HetI [Georgfuchsia toluolica]|uniref:4'-phosphopantetheinyl transferase HetI n=1 Tax=Georgfuchsia toluolica TaxID=424218 RepID=A0A916J1F2_9PROT|nr:4'-phosphopantetheinyl transferase superfamily protein [Georgfuchsia toluolica]CAG4882932.1 putative 4'-phosphopantetheinyl transferase HetI [Georgfuchsia toluolica]
MLAKAAELSTDNPAIEVAVVRLDVAPSAVDAAAALLSAAERRRASRFAFVRDRRRYIVARAQLRRLLGTRLQVRPEAVEFVYGESGKPALAQPFADSELHFSVTHADDFAAYAFSRGCEIGVDIEAVRIMPEAATLAAQFFSQRENAAYRALDACDQPLGFFNCWTRKEAFVKALGIGLGYPLDSFDVSLAPDEPARFLRVDNLLGKACGWTLHSLAPSPGLIGAVVVRHAADATPPTFLATP